MPKKLTPQTKIEQTILRVLDNGGLLFTESRTWTDVNIELAGQITRAQFDAALTALLAKEPAQVFCSPTDDGNKWKLTAAGEARLSEL